MGSLPGLHLSLPEVEPHHSNLLSSISWVGSNHSKYNMPAHRTEISAAWLGDTFLSTGDRGVGFQGNFRIWSLGSTAKFGGFWLENGAGLQFSMGEFPLKHKSLFYYSFPR